MSRVPIRRRVLAVLTSALLLVGAMAGTASAANPQLVFSGLPAVITAGSPAPFHVLVIAPGGGIDTGGSCGVAYVQVTVGSLPTANVTPVAGDAAFPDSVLPLSQLLPGTYSVTAYQDGSCGGLNGAASIQVVAAGTTCPPGQACTTPPIVSPGGSVASITAGPGATISAAFVTRTSTPCAGESNHDPNALAFNVTGSSAPKLIKDVLPGTGQARMCWNSPNDFTQRGGGMAPADPAGGYTGLLPDCLQAHPTLPCVLLVVPSARSNTTTVWMLAPAGDPQVKG